MSPEKLSLELPCPERFSLWSTVWSSGWAELAPFHADKESRILVGVLEPREGQVVKVKLRQERREEITVIVESRDAVSGEQLADVQRQIETSLRLDEDFSTFYRLLEEEPKFHWVLDKWAGRVFRSPTVYEDVVKTIISTNCRWVQTKAMAERLCLKLGSRFNGSSAAFPKAERIAEAGEAFLKEEIRAGYRAPYLAELARRISSGELDVERWRHSPLGTDVLAAEIRGLRGVGEWSTKNILQLVNRYDQLAIDSWVRKQFSEIHNKGGPVSDEDIEEHYERFGRWRGLVLWLDIVKQYLV